MFRENCQKVLPTDIVLKVKRNENGNPGRFKVRAVADGSFQVQGSDYENVYAPVPKSNYNPTK